MARIALVTGGMRGIGEAASRRLKQAGLHVAPTYLGNDAKAESFSRETGIAPFKWDVSDHVACEDGVQQVVRALGGSVDILVNNAGITRDAVLHKMTPAQWHEVIGTILEKVVAQIPSDASDSLRRLRVSWHLLLAMKPLSSPVRPSA